MRRIYTNKIDHRHCKPYLQKTLPQIKSSFCYWALLDDFGEVLRYLPWHTDKDHIKSLGSRVAEVRRQKPPLNNEECLF